MNNITVTKVTRKKRGKTAVKSNVKKNVSSFMGNIIPIYDKLVEYGLDKKKIIKYGKYNGKYNLHIKLPYCTLSVVCTYNVFKSRYVLETMIMDYDKQYEKQIYKLYQTTETKDPIKFYKNVKELYNMIIKLKKFTPQ